MKKVTLPTKLQQYYFFACLFSLYLSPLVAAPLKATLLIPAPKEHIASSFIPSICKRLETPCNSTSTRALIAKRDHQEQIYLIDTKGPLLIALDSSSPENTALAQPFDFSQYRHSAYSNIDEEHKSIEIYPALYPLENNNYAIAIVNTTHEMYSGGGSFISTADFIHLNPAKKNPQSYQDANVIYAGVPFSCGKLIRACFSEKDYKLHGKNCHEEYDGHLTINYGHHDQWTFFWHQSHLPAYTKKSTSIIKRFTIPTQQEKPNHLNTLGLSVCGESR